MEERIDTLFENSRNLLTPNKVYNEKDLKRKSNKIINIKNIKVEIEEIKDNLNEEIYMMQQAPNFLKIISCILPPIGGTIFLSKISKKPEYAKKCMEFAIYGISIYLTILIMFFIRMAYNGMNKTDEEIIDEYNKKRIEVYSEKGIELEPIIVETEETKEFNKHLEAYIGNEIIGSQVRSLYSVVDNHNTFTNTYKVTILYNNREIIDFVKELESINVEKDYKVIGIRNNQGFIFKMYIEDVD